MALRALIIVFILTGVVAVASAEFYRYIDEQGKAHFTDDLANVPHDQWPTVDKYEEVYHVSTPSEKPAETKEQEGEAPKEPMAEEGEESTEGKSLREKGAELQTEYQALMEEREQLSKLDEKASTEGAPPELAEKIEDFNARIEDYQKRRAAFNKEVDAYNTGMQEKAQPPPTTPEVESE